MPKSSHRASLHQDNMSQIVTRAWVGGQWVTGRAGTFSVMDPATGDEIAKVADCTVEEVNAAIGKGRGRALHLKLFLQNNQMLEIKKNEIVKTKRQENLGSLRSQ